MIDTIEDALNACTAEDLVIMPPEDKMENKTFADMKKIFGQNHGKWKGGKKQHFEFPFKTLPFLGDLRRGKRPNFKQDWHFFATTPPVIEQMCNLHIPGSKLKICEPSAGQGHIVEGVNAFMPYDHEWTLIEPNPVNVEILQEKGFDPIVCNFEDWDSDELFDVIYANPPFKHDKLHVTKMITHLVENGDLICVLPANFEQKYHEFVDEVLWSNFGNVSFYPVEEGAFKASGTTISTVILYCTDKVA
jgi:hypothetical protein